MVRKKHRLIAIILGLASLSMGITIILQNFNDNIIFFYSPTEIKKQMVQGKTIRIGGLVKNGTVVKQENGGVTKFVLTDLESDITVEYKGILPSLFRESQGMVAKGTILPSGTFIADELLAKHDENYMPKEVEEALKKSGRWKPESKKDNKNDS
jgi:cytochrome c-type biogenesis protein CcmE